MGPQVSQMPANIPELQQWSMFHNAANSRDPNTIVNAIKEIKDPYQKAELQNQLAEIAGFQRNTNNAQKAVASAIQSGDPKELNKALTNKDWGKIALAYLASIFGMKELGRDLAAEGGLGEFNIYGETSIGDHTASIVSAPNGRTLRGVWNSGPNKGQELTPSELQQTYGDLGGAGGKTTKPTTHGNYVKTDDNGKVTEQGTLMTEYRGNKPVQYVLSDGKKKPFDPTWKPEGISTAAAKAEINTVADLKKQFGTDVLKAEAQYQRDYGPFGSERNPFKSNAQFRQYYNYGTGMPGGTGSGTGTSTGTGTGEGTDTPMPRIVPEEERKVAREVAKDIAKTRGEGAAKEWTEKSGNILSNLGKAERAEQNIKSGAHLLGGGSNAIRYNANEKLPLKEKSTEFNNTLELEKLAAIENLDKLSAYFKPLSNADLETIKSYQMSRNSSPEQWAKWLYHYKRAESAAYNRLVEEMSNPQTMPSKLPVEGGTSTGTGVDPAVAAAKAEIERRKKQGQK